MGAMSRINFVGIILIAVLLISLGLGLPGTVIRALSPHPADACPIDASWAVVLGSDPLGVMDLHGWPRRCVYNDSHLPVEPEDLR